MKIFKLKYFVLSLVATSLLSCVKDDIIKEADKEAVTESNAFVFEEDINNYIINGKLSYDRKEIANAAKNAWNIHYDYPHNKVVISTNPTEFEKYKNTDLEFKKRFEKNETVESSKNIALSYRIPDGTPDHSEGISFIYERTSGDKFFIMFKLFANPNFLTAGTGVRHYPTDNYPRLNSAFTILGIEMINTITSGGTGKLHIRNHNNSSSKTFTVYRGENYTGTSKSMTLAKNEDRRVYNVFFKVTTTEYAQSMK